MVLSSPVLGALDTAREVVSPAEEEASFPPRPSTSSAALVGGVLHKMEIDPLFRS